MTCLKQYAKNYLGQTQSDEEIANVPCPGLELGIHITLKFVQLGMGLGVVVLAPVATLLTKQRSLDLLKANTQRFGVGGALVGGALGMAMACYRVKTLPIEGLYDRSYRLRRNANQVRSDQSMMLGTLVGASVGALMRPPQLSLAIVSASVFGLFAGGFYNMSPLNKAKPEKKS